jgi:DNA-3-methyladenine glycosylase
MLQSTTEGQGERIVLPQEFYERDTLIVARELLGQRLVRVVVEDAPWPVGQNRRQSEGARLSGRIVEVEAYKGLDDQASHAARGWTPRNAVMFGPPGHAYIYFTYGMHFCLNVVTEPEGFPAAVLIRAIAPMEGIEAMRRNRPGRSDQELTNGPGKLCQALQISRSLNGVPLIPASSLFIEQDHALAARQIVVSPRIGVHGNEQACSAPWRFFIQGNPHVSR